MINGFSIDDSINNGGGKVTINNGAGNDNVEDRGDNNIIDLGDGNDYIFLLDDSSTIIAGKGSGSITIKDGAGKKLSIVDEKGNLTTQAYGASVIAVSDSDSDTIDVTNDSAVLKIDASNRTKGVKLIGNSKANTLVGGEGDDELTGGKGKDVFVYNGGNDIITDYKVNEDTIKFDGITFKSAEYVGESMTDLQFTFVEGGSLTIENVKPIKSIKGKPTVQAPMKVTIIDRNDLITSQVYDLATITGGINTMSGSAAADSINGWTSNDLLVGGKGKDVFIYSTGNDTISDYTAKQDSILINNNLINVNDYYVDGKDVIFSIDENDSLTILNGKDKSITINNQTKVYNDPTEKVLDKKDSGKQDFSDDSKIITIDGSKTTKGVEIVGNSNDNTIIAGKGKDILTGGAFVDADDNYINFGRTRSNSSIGFEERWFIDNDELDSILDDKSKLIADDLNFNDQINSQENITSLTYSQKKNK